MRQHPHKLRARKRARQQGAALLIVLFVLLMATTTAVYSLSSTQYEVRAAGALHQSMRAKFVSEAATNGSIAYCLNVSGDGCTNSKHAAGGLDGTTRQTFALPSWGSEQVIRLDRTDMVGPAFKNPLLANDTVISGIDSSDPTKAGAAGAWAPAFLTVMEKWDMNETGGNVQTNLNKKYRLVMSTYGTLDYDADGDGVADDVAVTNSNELRAPHSTISATRAYIDLQN
ncbi:MAG TPA: hypothetical protein VFX59_19065 [Polyangiales bacterium]|nr:hypothetical protein [Polyangiales bacterium]